MPHPRQKAIENLTWPYARHHFRVAILYGNLRTKSVAKTEGYKMRGYKGKPPFTLVPYKAKWQAAMAGYFFCAFRKKIKIYMIQLHCEDKFG